MKLFISISGSDILYHRTTITALADILKNGFVLKPSDGTEAEQKMAQNYYLSCARSLMSSYLNTLGTYSAVIKLDGSKLGRRYKITPVDYWGMKVARNEMEDRVWSKGPKIGTDAILEVHLLKDGALSKKNIYTEIKKSALLKHIPVYVYESVDDLRLQRKIKAVQLKIDKTWLKQPDTHRRSFYRDPRINSIRGWLELYLKPAGKKLSDQAELKYRNLGYTDSLNVLNADMHNAKGNIDKEREYLDRLIAVLRKNKWTPKQFLAFLENKWLKRNM